MKCIYYLSIISVAISSTLLYSIDNPHSYRATNFFNFFLEPRLEHTSLSSFDATISHGSTTKGYNAHHTLVPLFDIYGTHNIKNIIRGVPLNEEHTSYTQLLQSLSLLPARPNFATLSIEGKFSITEANFAYTQNLMRGFLLFFHIPVRKLSIKQTILNDLSPDDSLFPNKNTPEWHAVIQKLPSILHAYDIGTHATKEHGFGDLSSLVGWTHNYQETTTIDFIDATIMAGILAPTGKKRKENELFSLPLGYNGHWGFSFASMASLGIYEWITFGWYLDTLFFTDTIKTMPIKTDNTQRGIVKLAQTDVTVHKGALWDTGLYLKADHFVYGLSFTASYSYAGEAKNHIKPLSGEFFDRTIMNSDPQLDSWNMHTFHFVAEYDFTKQDAAIGKRIGLFYNYQISGKRTFKTNVVGGSFGLDIAWDI